MVRTLGLIGVSFIVLIFNCIDVHACDCAGGANPCDFFRGETGVAFIGTVTDVVDSNEKYGEPVKGKVRKITIKVDEMFQGSLPSVIVTSDDGYQCDNYPFTLGGSYLIYAAGVLENTQNIVKIGLCSGTAPIEMAQDAITFLRQLRDGKSISIHYGKIQKPVNLTEQLYEPLPNIPVVLTKLYTDENGQRNEPEKNERERRTLTDENGEYKFENLSDGIYKVSAILPNDLWTPEVREFGAGTSPHCSAHSLVAYANGRISGSAVHWDGRPAAHLKLRISPTETNTVHYYGETQTDRDGIYTFHGLSEGQYKISVYLPWYSLDGSRSYPFERYPFSTYYYGNVFEESQANIIRLDHNTKLQDIKLKMPPLPVKRLVTGVVVDEFGNPVKAAEISYKIKSIGESSRLYVYSQNDGTFSLSTYEEFEYEIGVTNISTDNPLSSGWMTFNKNDLKHPIKIVLGSRK